MWWTELSALIGSAPKHASEMKKTQTMILAKITRRCGRPGNPRRSSSTEHHAGIWSTERRDFTAQLFAKMYLHDGVFVTSERRNSNGTDWRARTRRPTLVLHGTDPSKILICAKQWTLPSCKISRRIILFPPCYFHQTIDERTRLNDVHTRKNIDNAATHRTRSDRSLVVSVTWFIF